MQIECPSFKIKEFVEADNYGKFVISPLERGFGTTLGNAIRRCMLSSLPGGAVYAIKFNDGGVYHEFTSLDGIKEDVTMMILNIKGLVIKVNDENPKVLRINKKGPGVVTAGDIVCEAGCEILNKDLEIAHLDKGGNLSLTLWANKGRGYVSADENKQNPPKDEFGISIPNSGEKGVIYTDSIYTPVLKANFDVEPTRVGQKTKYDELTIEVWTNSTIHPKQAIALSSEILSKYLNVLTNVDELQEEVIIDKDSDNEKNSKTVYGTSIDDLDLTQRSYNSLKKHDVNTVGDILQYSEDELNHFRNFGKKSLTEVKEKLAELGLSLKNKE